MKKKFIEIHLKRYLITKLKNSNFQILISDLSKEIQIIKLLIINFIGLIEFSNFLKDF